MPSQFAQQASIPRRLGFIAGGSYHFLLPGAPSDGARSTSDDAVEPSGELCYDCNIMARKKRAGSTITLSISISPKDAAVLRKRAKRLHGGNVSAAIGDAAELLRIEENRQAFAARLNEEFGPLDAKLARAILMETMGVIPAVRRRKKRAA